MTHTLEVAQLARTIGRALRLNEDLIEAVAYGHDLGQPPFGPTGERALDDLLSGVLDGAGGAGLGDLGGFHRSWQSLRVVDLLEKRYQHPGLNLTDDTREGIVKSGPIGDRSLQEIKGVRAGLAPTLEVQVVLLADRIAAALHDLDDALQAGAVDVRPRGAVAGGGRAEEKARGQISHARGPLHQGERDPPWSGPTCSSPASSWPARAP